jgi:hypothetical protein
MPSVVMTKASLLLSSAKVTMLPAMATPPQGTGLLPEHLTSGIRRGEAYTPRASGVPSSAAHMEEPYMYKYLYT